MTLMRRYHPSFNANSCYRITRIHVSQTAVELYAICLGQKLKEITILCYQQLWDSDLLLPTLLENITLTICQ